MVILQQGIWNVKYRPALCLSSRLLNGWIMQKTEERQTEHQKLLEVPKHKLWKHKTAILCYSMLPCCMLFLSSKYRIGHFLRLLSCACSLMLLLCEVVQDIHTISQICTTDPTQDRLHRNNTTPSQFQSFLKTGYSCLKYRLWSETHGQNDRVSLKHCSSAKPWFFHFHFYTQVTQIVFLPWRIYLSLSYTWQVTHKRNKSRHGSTSKVTSPFCTETAFNCCLCSLNPQSIQVQLKVLNKEHEKPKVTNFRTPLCFLPLQEYMTR